MCRPVWALRRQWLGRAIASHEWHCACSSRCDRGVLKVEPACATPGRPPPAVAGEGSRVARVAQCVLVSLRSQRASGTRCCLAVLPPAGAAGKGECRAQTALDVPVSHECDAPAEWHMVWPCCAALRQRGWGHVQSAGRGRGGRTRQVRHTGCAGLAVMATRWWRHTHVRPVAGPPAGRGRGGRSRRARGTRRAGLAAMAARRWRHTQVWPGSGPPSAVAGEG